MMATEKDYQDIEAQLAFIAKLAGLVGSEDFWVAAKQIQAAQVPRAPAGQRPSSPKARTR